MRPHVIVDTSKNPTTEEEIGELLNEEKENGEDDWSTAGTLQSGSDSPQSGSGSSQTGSCSPQTGSCSPQTGSGSPQAGTASSAPGSVENTVSEDAAMC